MFLIILSLVLSLIAFIIGIKFLIQDKRIRGWLLIIVGILLLLYFIHLILPTLTTHIIEIIKSKLKELLSIS